METNNHMSRELLKSIQENAAIGKLTLGRLIKRSKDAEMRTTLAQQFAEYHKIVCEAESLMCEMNVLESHHAPRTAILTALSLNLKLDSTSSHMAEMVIQGCVMGMIGIKQQLRESQGADERIRSLAHRLFATEENNMKQLFELV